MSKVLVFLAIVSPVAAYSVRDPKTNPKHVVLTHPQLQGENVYHKDYIHDDNPTSLQAKKEAAMKDIAAAKAKYEKENAEANRSLSGVKGQAITKKKN